MALPEGQHAVRELTAQGRRSSPLRPAPSLVRETGSAARPGQKQRH
jgi:hypothetical protein